MPERLDTMMDPPVEELLDQLGEDSPPVAVGEIMAEVATRIGAPAHRDL